MQERKHTILEFGPFPSHTQTSSRMAFSTLAYRVEICDSSRLCHCTSCRRHSALCG